MKLVALMRKEFHRFFHDPKLIITILIPGIVIFMIYSLIGGIVGDATNAPKTYDYKVYRSGSSAILGSIEQIVSKSGSKITWLEVNDPKDAVAAVEKGDASAYISFSENFDSFAEGAQVDIYYSSSDDGAGETFYSLASGVLQSYGMRFALIPHTVFNEEDIVKEIWGGILPMLVVTFVFSACMSVTLESVAGEKERGTLTTILATSVKRSHIALGKIIPLSCIAVLGATSSFLGVTLSLPKLTGLSFGSFAASFGFLSYFFLFLLIVSFVPLIVSLITVFSAYAKTVKEASAYTGIVMLFVIVLSLVTTFVGNLGGWVAAVPVLNAVAMMQEILSGSVPVLGCLLSIGANIVYSGLLVLAISKMLSSERIMFGK